MSDEISQSCTGREVFNIILSNTEIREPVHPYQTQWMAHWSQASSSSSFQSHNHNAFANVIENQVGYNGRFSMANSRSNFDSFCSEPKLPFPSMNLENFTSYQFQNSTGISSEWTHFPMIEINRRIQPMVAPKKKTSFNSTEAKMNEQVLPLTSSMPNYSENDLYYSGLAFKEHFANANLSYLKQGLCNSTKNSTIMVSEMKNDNQKFSGSSSTRLKNGSSSFPYDVPHRFLAEECSKQSETVFGRNKSVIGLSEPNKMPNCAAIGSRKREFREFSNATQYLLITKEVGENSCYNDQIVEGSSVSAKVKGTAFYEKLTVPTMLYDHTDARFTMKENKNVEIDINELPSSPEDGSSCESRKVPQEDLNLNTKTSEVEDSSSSRTESVDALPKNPSKPPNESTESGSDPSSKWVKRLRPNILDCTPLSTKGFNKEHSSSSGMQNLLSTVVSYNRTICDLTEPCGDQEKETPWIRRWCKSSASKERASPKETNLLFEPENLKLVSENSEARQFPSLAAMALMGKQVTNYRPCEFRKRGSTTIWNI